MPLLASQMGGFMPLLILFILLIAFTVWQGKRQAKRQQEERAKLESNLQEGSRVMLSSGLFVTVTHLGDKQAVVELAPGVEVNVLKQAIVRAAGDEEEFAFADDAPAQTAAADDLTADSVVDNPTENSTAESTDAAVTDQQPRA